MLPLVRLLDGQGTVVIRSSEATDGVGRDAGDLTRKSAEDAGTSPCRHVCRQAVTAGRPQVQLPPADVPPLAVLVTNVLVDADRLEAECFVDSDAGFIRERYAGHEEAVTGRLQAFEQLGVQTATEAGSVSGLVDVRAHLDRRVVRGALAVAASVRVAEDLTVALHDQPDVSLSDPHRHLLGGRRLGLERDRALGHVRLIDRGARRGVFVGVGVADRQAAVGPEGASSSPPPPAGPASCSAVSGGGGVSAGAGAAASAGAAGCSAAAVPAVAGAAAGWPPSGASGTAWPSVSGTVAGAAGMSVAAWPSASV